MKKINIQEGWKLMVQAKKTKSSALKKTAAKRPGTAVKRADPGGTVLVRVCEEYDRDRIYRIIVDGMKTLGYVPSGKVFVKPNVVYAGKPEKYGSTTYTHPDVIAASLLALSKSKSVSRVDLGEKCGMGTPTRYTFINAGYYDVVKQLNKDRGAPIGIFCIDEERRDRVFIGGAVHSVLRVARKMARADSKVYLPKLKCHCVSNMTGAVKLNIGICSEDERAIRHDFLLNDKIVDLLGAGYPDFTIMDAIDVGVGNEAVPYPRRVGLILMGRNPLAVDLVAARLLGYGLKDIPYLQRAVERGYTPRRLEEVRLIGDITTIKGIDERAKRAMPYDDEFYRWQDINKEFARLRTPMKLYHGISQRMMSASPGSDGKCKTGCIMGLKMFFGWSEAYAGSERFKDLKKALIVVGKVDEEIDAGGGEVFLVGSCAAAPRLANARRVTRIDKCFTTTVDLLQSLSTKVGLPTPFTDPVEGLPLFKSILTASLMKHVNLRYLQDIGHFMEQSLMKRI
jgi:uncharacterized protein (DUF362 family)